MRALVLSAAAVFPAAFTGRAAWAAAAGSGPGEVAAGVPAFLGWALWAFLAAWVRPRREKRAEWTAQEAAALDGGTDLKRVLDAAPRRKGKR